MLKIQDRQTKHNRFLDHDHDHHIILMSGGGERLKNKKKREKTSNYLLYITSHVGS